MNKTTEALKMAIEYLTNIQLDYKGHETRKACQEALESQEQEPVADYIYVNPVTKEQYAMVKLNNTHPAQPLNELDIWNLLNKTDIPADFDRDCINFARAIEQAHGIK